MRLKWKLVSVRLEVVLILTEHRCTVCAIHTIGSEIVWTHWMEHESHFGPFRDNVSVGAR
jgi:hypothetical protein